MDITLKDVGEIIKKSWALILVLTVAATAAGYLLSAYVLQKEYEATALVIVNFTAHRESQVNNMTAGDYDLNVRLVNSYSVICKSDRVLSQVKDRLKLNIDLDKLSEKIVVSSEQGTDIISLAVTDPSPETAQGIANTLVDVFKTEVMHIMKMDNVQVIDHAVLPRKPVRPNGTVNTAVAGLIGLVVSLIIAVIRFSSDDTIKDVAIISDIFDAPVIGSVPRLG